jgi:hypothetical protein
MKILLMNLNLKMNKMVMMVNNVMLMLLFHQSIHLNDENYSNVYLYNIHWLIINFLNQMFVDQMVYLHMNNDHLMKDDNVFEMFDVHHHQNLGSN